MSVDPAKLLKESVDIHKKVIDRESTRNVDEENRSNDNDRDE